jgi:hypothetical protein
MKQTRCRSGWRSLLIEVSEPKPAKVGDGWTYRSLRWVRCESIGSASVQRLTRKSTYLATFSTPRLVPKS